MLSTRREFLGTAGCALAAPVGQATADWRDQGILHLEASPHARLKNIPVRAFTMHEGFWAPRRKANVERSIPTLLQLLEEHGVVDNFRRLSGRKKVPRRGPLYTDSDLYKWMEAVAFVLQSEDRPDLRATFDRLTEEILAAQEPSGYLNTYYVEERRNLRFKEMHRGHELYCLGHLLQAAIAYYRATGGTRLLEGGIRFVNYLTDNFGRDKDPLLAGHPCIEMALVELYRMTRDRRHLDLAAYLLEGDGERLKLTRQQMVYLFSGKPFISRTQLEGHAVRAMYACCGAADYLMETGDGAYARTLEALWQDLARGKLYITGGVGSRAQGEAFGEPYELPNRLAYTESCAAIGNVMWNWRLLAARGEARFADMLERALYNGVNSGMSLSGDLYCYRNPLELSGDPEDRIRNPWYDTTCCPPNLERTFAALPGYFYSTSSEGVWVHLYHAGALDWRLPGCGRIELVQKTQYPWEGRVELDVRPERPAEFTLFLRIPAWASGAKLAVNGAPQPVRPGEYAVLRRSWRPGDRVVLELPLEVRLTVANPMVAENWGRAAVERGPLVYCVEQLDHPGVSIFDLLLDPAAGFTAEFRPDLLGGVVVLRHKGRAWQDSPAAEPLYGRWPRPARPTRPVEITLIPYYTFHNRGITAMRVWLPMAGA
ncbi:MAG: glycoside hydrolase family 127 protein [Bryobacterales bacterium]|nr:glycoside hydrolase family 127 protein [Bryobacteraceae bacterium]MDW8129843.1 glycoside hydrolase family 127 protein [Bryobacterales bacterium]